MSALSLVLSSSFNFLSAAPVAPSSVMASPSASTLSADAHASWAPVVLLIVIGLLFAVANLGASLFLGPKRTGPGKSQTYESGMVPIGNAQSRFNVRFYIVAMIFLVFDVEIVFFYPWATLFPGEVARGAGGGGTLMLLEMVVFVAILLVAYFYAWGKGVFKWD